MNALTLGIFASAFGVLWLLLIVAVFILLVLLYQQTRATAFLWLMLATTVLPIMTRLFTMLLPFWLVRWAADRAYTIQTTALVSTSVYGLLALLEAGALLIAALRLRRWASALAPSATTVQQELSSGPFYPQR